MPCLRFIALLVVLTTFSFAKNDNWTELRTPHFVVLTNSNEKEARRLGDQFERMRAVFHKAFPNLAIESGTPITVLAVKDRKDFQALEPSDYLAKGQLNLAGLFLRTPDKNYVLLRLDVEGSHPYEVVYHEYTHFLLAKAEWLPLWVNEGLAQYYETTDILDKEVELGQPSAPNLYLLNQSRLLPLATLFKVDHSSPYYHEENKGSIFYAESWALIHMLMIEDRQHKTQKLLEYFQLLASHVDPVTAGTRAFGDLNALQKHLESYVAQRNFYHFRMQGATEVDSSTYKARPLPLLEADAVRADFLAYDRRESDARVVLDHVLEQDPKNVQACETMGYLAFRSGNLEEAAKWYGKAVSGDSQSYLANYYFAVINLRGSHGAEDEQVEKSLRTAIKLNPDFAPAYDALARFYGMHQQRLEEARMLSLEAIVRDPENVNYRLNNANLQLEMGRPADALAVLQNALKVAKTPEQQMAVNRLMDNVEKIVKAGGSLLVLKPDAKVEAVEDVKDDVPDDDDSNHGAKRSVHGTLSEVSCSYPTHMKIQVAGAKAVDLRSNNYMKIDYTALNFKPTQDMNPCKDLAGMKATVDYFESAEPGKPGWIVAIQVTK